MSTVGEISVVASIDTSKYKRGAKEIESANKEIEVSTNNTGGAFDKLNAKLGRMAKGGLKIAAGGMAALAATVATMTIKGGIDRALNIEDAQAKLKGLGHDADSVENIMNSALDSVRGTAYGLDAAATIAASAVAAGVKPGQQLTKYLGTTADAATIAGVSLSEMGSIFNKVQTQQRAYTMELNQLADRGIPIYQWLQEELGVTQEALREMVAKGELDSDTYFKVIQKNIGGAALESGKTTRGAWANLQAAMSRVGARIVSGPIENVRIAFGDMTKWIDANSDSIVYAVQDTIDTMLKLGRAAISVGKFLWDMRAPIGGLVTAFIAYKAAIIAVNVVKAINAGLTSALVIRYKAQMAAMALARGATIAQTAAMVGLNAAMLANPIALVVAALAGLTAAIYIATTSTKGMTAEERYLNDTRTKSAEISERVKLAEDNLKTSRDDAKRASFDVKRAEEALARAVETYGKNSWQAEEATLDLDNARARERAAKDKNIKASEEMTAARKAERDMIDSINRRLDGLNGKVVTYTLQGVEMTAKNYGGKYGVVHAPGFSSGGYTGRGGMYEEAGIVHKGEYVLPKRMVDQKTGLPKDGIFGGSSSGIINNIQNVTISSEVDGERWLRRLSGNQEIVSSGLVPQQTYM